MSNEIKIIKLCLSLIFIMSMIFLISDKCISQTNKEIARSLEEVMDEDGLEKTIIHHENIIAKYPEEIQNFLDKVCEVCEV